MKKYKIADLIVGLDAGIRTMKNAEPYLIDTDEDTDITIIKDHDSAVKRFPVEAANTYFDKQFVYDTLDYMYARELFLERLLDFNGLVLHSSSVVYENKAYLFSAPSGTGKSTHTGKWLELFEGAYILNDDRPTIRVLDDDIYAYGTPWAGSTNINKNAKAKLQGICFLQRSDENWIKPMDSQMAVIRMLHGTSVNLQKENMVKQLEIIKQIINRIPIWEMGCNPTVDAAKKAYITMSKNF